MWGIREDLLVIPTTTSHYDWTRTLIRRFVRAG